jgi:hypothetical protein
MPRQTRLTNPSQASAAGEAFERLWKQVHELRERGCNPCFFPTGINHLVIEVKIAGTEFKVELGGPDGASQGISEPREGKLALASMEAASARAERPELTDELCREIAVRNAPRPERYKNNPAQLLAELSVHAGTPTRQHKRDIQDDLSGMGYQIRQNQITSGPDKTVQQCATSIKTNAT